jgi:hypothetical protein
VPVDIPRASAMSKRVTRRLLIVSLTDPHRIYAAPTRNAS